MTNKYFIFLLILFFKLNFIISQENKYFNYAKKDIQEALNKEKNDHIAKNVVIFIGDGMGLTTITASRIVNKGVEGYHVFEKFPNLALMKVYSNNKYVPDSASTGTAIFTGTKVNQRTVGVSPEIEKNDWVKLLNNTSYNLEGVAAMAQKAGKRTGFVTNTRVTHATPASFYAHSASREWECDTEMPEHCLAKDIARQLIEDEPGTNFNVIMGGGEQCLKGTKKEEKYSCFRGDNRDLINEWQLGKENKKSKYVKNTLELSSVNFNETDYLLGVFAKGHMTREYYRNKEPEGEPALSTMTLAALKTLNKGEGFLLMVEGGWIDISHHMTQAAQAINEQKEFENTIAKTLEYLESENILDETLVIVTSDHSHGLQMNGYPSRDLSLFDVIDEHNESDPPYTILSYGTGSKDTNLDYNNTHRNVIEENTRSMEYKQPSLYQTKKTYHGGSDVLLFAKGPKSFLFSNTHEQTYVSFVIQYAMRIGNFAENLSEENDEKQNATTETEVLIAENENSTMIPETEVSSKEEQQIAESNILKRMRRYLRLNRK